MTSKDTPFKLEDPETVKTWELWHQLYYAVQVEQHYPGHRYGILHLKHILQNLKNEDIEKITPDVTLSLFAVGVHSDDPKLLSLMLNNPSLPYSSHTDNAAKHALKRAIRTGSLNVVNYLIQQNVKILSNDIDEKNNFDDVKSLIFNILKSYEIGCFKLNNKAYQHTHNAWKCSKCDHQNNTNLYLCSVCGIKRNYDKTPNNSDVKTANIWIQHGSNNITIAKRFWNYLAKSLYELCTDNDESEMDEKAQLSEHWSEQDMDALSMKRYLKFMINYPLVKYSIYKYIQSLVVRRNCIYKLLPVLQFICEHYGVFNDDVSLDELYIKCKNDKLFNCSKLIEFKIRFQYVLLQDNKEKKFVKFFWSEYVLLKLINVYLGIDSNKMNVMKQMNNNNIEQEQLLLDCIEYIVGNGCAYHMKEIIMPIMIEYKNRLINEKYDKVNELFMAVESGKNIWMLKNFDNNEVVALFSNVDLPAQIAKFIVSFLVL